MTTVPTQFGDVPLDKLVQRYEAEKQREERRYVKRLEFLQTDEGKAWNRAHLKSYYERNKETILAKRKAKYVSRKKPKTPASSDSPVSE